MRRLVALTAALVLTIGSASSLAYLKLGAMVNGQVVDATWHQQPIGYFVSERAGNGVTAADLVGALRMEGHEKLESKTPRNAVARRPKPSARFSSSPWPT